MNSRIVWLGRHEGLLRDVARGCAYGDPISQKQGAMLLAPFIKQTCTIVPMPSHIGYATTMLSLCKWIRSIVNLDSGFKGVEICDCLCCDPHESSHVVKLRNGVPPVINMYARHKPPTKGDIYIIDNTIATGATARMALGVIPNATVLAITKG